MARFRSLSKASFRISGRRWTLAALGPWLGAAALAATGGGAAGQEGVLAPPPRAFVSHTIRSSSGRFRVYSPDFAEKQRLAIWADDTASRVERLTGSPLSFSNRVIFLQASHSTNSPAGTIRKEEGMEGGRLVQTLSVVNLEQVEGEELLEALCWLLLNGQVFDGRRDGSLPRTLHAVPEWLSVGVAQNLYPELKLRNSRWILDQEHPDGIGELSEIFRWQFLPEGRWREKAISGLVVGWLASIPDAPRVFRSLLAGAGEGEVLSAEWIAKHAVGADSAADLNRQWREWMARKNRSVRDLGTVSSRDVDKLMMALAIDAGELGTNAIQSAGEDVRMADLIPHRRLPAVRRLAAQKARALRLMSIGKDPEFQAVAALYCRFLEGLTSNEFGMILGRRLRTAETSLSQLATTVRAREDYMNRFEQNLTGRTGDSESAPFLTQTVFGTSEIKSYVDDFERRFTNTLDASGNPNRASQQP